MDENTEKEDFGSDAEESKRRAMERLERLKGLSFDVKSTDPNNESETDLNNEFETVPAYIRRNMELYSSSSDPEAFYSNYNQQVEDDSLRLIFNLSEYDKSEIVEIISALSSLYNSVGGDGLKIRYINTFDLISNEIPVLT